MVRECDKLISPREAIEMVQRCRKDRLTYVLDILRVAGYEFSAQEVGVSRAVKVSIEKMNELKRQERKHNWKESHDEAIVLLREAYLKGIKVTDINRLTGVNRTVIYEYLKGERDVPLAYRERLIKTLRELLERREQTDG